MSRLLVKRGHEKSISGTTHRQVDKVQCQDLLKQKQTVPRCRCFTLCSVLCKSGLWGLRPAPVLPKPRGPGSVMPNSLGLISPSAHPSSAAPGPQRGPREHQREQHMDKGRHCATPNGLLHCFWERTGFLSNSPISFLILPGFMLGPPLTNPSMDLLGFLPLIQSDPLLRFPRLHSALYVAIPATTVHASELCLLSWFPLHACFPPLCHLGFYCPCAQQRISQEGTGRPPGRLESQSLPTYPLGYGRMCGKSIGEGRC